MQKNRADIYKGLSIQPLTPILQQTHTLYLGDIDDAKNLLQLRKLNITSVLTAAKGFNLHYPKCDNLNHLILPCLDEPSFAIEKYFDESYNFISKGLQRGSVLVHCQAGVSRSVTIVAAFLMRKMRWPAGEALEFIKKKRGFVNPNEGFLQKLKHLEKQLCLRQDNSKQVRPSFQRSRVLCDKSFPQNQSPVESYRPLRKTLRSDERLNINQRSRYLNQVPLRPEEGFQQQRLRYQPQQYNHYSREKHVQDWGRVQTFNRQVRDYSLQRINQYSRPNYISYPEQEYMRKQEDRPRPREEYRDQRYIERNTNQAISRYHQNPRELQGPTRLRCETQYFPREEQFQRRLVDRSFDYDYQ